jgi:rhodanese-related sulfurtransferase
VIRVKSCEQTWIRVIWQGGAILLLAAAIGLSVNQLRPAKLPLVADWSPLAQLTMESGDTLEVSLDQAEELFHEQVAVFLDARSPELYAEGHIQGAFNLPWDEFESRFAEAMVDIPTETLIITYCDGETCNLSKELALALFDKGYANAHVLVNGWTVWQERNLPVETGGTR